MKKVTLHNVHEELGAKMVPFAGFQMPVSYEGVNIEHQTVRNGVGVFDVSHMGEFFIRGPKALELIQKISSNDASGLKVGQAQYCYLPNEKGGIVDDLIIYKLQEEEYMLVVNASNIEKDWEWISKQNTMNAEIEDLSDSYSLLAIQGPKALEAMQPLTSADLKSIKFYNFKRTDFAGVDDILISATGYTGSGGFEVYCRNENVKQIWDAVFEAGEDFGIKPIGLAARDTLRLEMGFCLYGNEIDEDTSPFEAGLGWITKFTKDFINSENLQKEKEAGLKRKLIGFELNERGIPRKDYKIINSDGDPIGIVTSGTMAPSLGKAIGLGFVEAASSEPGTEIFIEIRKKPVSAKIVKTPFYKG